MTEREAVFERDRGVCAQCGFDTERARVQLAGALELGGIDLRAVAFGCPSPDHRDLLFDPCSLVTALLDDFQERRYPRRYALVRGRHLWEADHVIPRSEGGRRLGLGNLRTLCLPDHRAASAELAARRRHRLEKQVPRWAARR